MVNIKHGQINQFGSDYAYVNAHTEIRKWNSSYWVMEQLEYSFNLFVKGGLRVQKLDTYPQ